MRSIKKKEKIGIAVAGAGALGVIYLLSSKEETSDTGGFSSGGGGFPVSSIESKKEAIIPEGFSVFQPVKDTEKSVLPSIKDYDSWRESIKRPDPVTAPKKVVSTPTPTPTPTQIPTQTPVQIPDMVIPVAHTFVTNLPSKKESIAKAKEIPVSNISTVLAKSKTEKKSFWGTFASMITSDNVKKTVATPRQKTIALETAGKTAAFGPGSIINMIKAAGVKTPATKKQKTGALQTAGYTAAFGPGAGIASSINNAFNMPGTRKPKFSATAARYGGAAAGYGKGYTTTKKGGAAVSRTSSGWSGGSTRDRIDTATKAGVHGLSYR